MRRVWIIGSTILAGLFIVQATVQATTPDGNAPQWSNPAIMALKRAGPASSLREEPAAFNNMDCTLFDYRSVGSNSMQSGCFAPTALGQFNVDNAAVIFNGTDESLPLIPYTARQVLVPWPNSSVLIALTAAPVDGFYVNLYSGTIEDLKDQRDYLGQLKAKSLSVPPEQQLLGPDGKQLIINPQTLAFSDGGSWMVVEDLNGSFVRINLATLDVLPFAPSIAISGNPALLRSQVAITHDGRFVAINNEAAGSFKVYDLASCSGETITNLSPVNCKSYDYRYFIAQKLPSLQNIRHVRFINDGLLSFDATTPGDTGVYELAPTASITSLTNYLGLGDSYTSGEGAFDYLTGTDTKDNVCHLSINSYPLLLISDFFGPSGGHSVACSGAVINDVGSMSVDYRGQARDSPSWKQLQQDPVRLNLIMAGFSPGYVAQERFAAQYQPGITTVSVGGDDIGFGDVLQECIEPKLSLHVSDDTCYGTYEQRLELENLIDRTVPRWKQLYKSLSAGAPSSRIYAIGYPQIASDKGDCGLNVHLGKSELEFAIETVDYLNDAIKQAAAQAGVPYVDIGQALAGHRLCETAGYNVAVNGLTNGSDVGALGINFLGKESYHPNAFGQQLIEQSILKQTHNFAQEAVINNPSPPDGKRLLSRPKTGKTVRVRIPNTSSTTKKVSAGQAITISANGLKFGLKPNAPYTVHTGGPDGQSIGNIVGDASGNITGTIVLPGGTQPGGHTIDVTGSNQAGEPIDLTQPIYTPVSSTDSDGDGVPDSNDLCVYAVNSGADSDQDGIDDACDPLIGLPPSSGNANSSNQSGQGTSPDDRSGSVLDYTSITTLASFPVKGKSTAQLLGSATANPTKLAQKNLAILKSQPRPGSHNYPGLRAFTWWPWLKLLALVWFVLLLIYAVLWLREKYENKYSNGGLSTTISL